MRRIEWTNQFKRDYKRELKGRYSTVLDDLLFAIIDNLANDIALELRYHDHFLNGIWSDHRDCHIKPDLILIYRKWDIDILQLVRLGSHSQLSIY